MPMIKGQRRLTVAELQELLEQENPDSVIIVSGMVDEDHIEKSIYKTAASADDEYVFLYLGGDFPSCKDNFDSWKTVSEEEPEEDEEVEVKVAGKVMDAVYKGIFSTGVRQPFAATWEIRGERVRNNVILWRPKE